MKKILFIILLSLLNVTFANVEKGSQISAKKFNESSLSIGTIQTSLLTENQFQSLQGSCWVKMQGQDVSTSDYGQLKKDSANNQDLVVLLPNSSGRFLRDSGGYAEPLGKVQDDAIRNITGEVKSTSTNEFVLGEENITGSGAFEMLPSISQYNPTKGSATTQSRGFKFDAGNVVPVAEENRPKNLTVNMFIKINHDCN